MTMKIVWVSPLVMLVLTPMPSANVKAATAAKPGDLRNVRMATGGAKCFVAAHAVAHLFLGGHVLIGAKLLIQLPVDLFL